jgi:spore protease
MFKEADRLNLDFYKAFNIHVDLAVEAHEIVRGETGREIPGVIVDREKYENTTVTIVKIVEEDAEQLMGKPRGNYITIEAPALRDNNREAQQEVAEVLAEKLKSLFKTFLRILINTLITDLDKTTDVRGIVVD